MDAQLERRLREGASSVGVHLDERMLQGVERYLDLLLFWNRKVNLTAIRDAPEVIDRHFVDSLALLPFLPPDTRTLVDIGSGAGFPGAVLALALPDLSVFLVESVHKKAAFLEALRRELPLPNARVFAERAEDWAASQTSLPDVAVSRAVWDLSEWLQRSASYVRPGGTVLGMEAADLHSLPTGATRHAIHHPSGRRSVIVYQCST